MVKCKFTVSHHGHRFQLLFNIRSEKAVLFLLDYLFVVDLNGPVFVYKLFWSDLIVKVSFIAWASGDGPFALARSHGNCAQHRENERFLLSKPWIWMATPAFLICILFSPYVRTPMLYKCLCVYAFFTQFFTHAFSGFSFHQALANEWWQYSIILHMDTHYLPKDTTFIVLNVWINILYL